MVVGHLEGFVLSLVGFSFLTGEELELVGEPEGLLEGVPEGAPVGLPEGTPVGVPVGLGASRAAPLGLFLPLFFSLPLPFLSTVST